MAQATNECPACSGKRSKPYSVNGREMIAVRECVRCGAVFGECYLGESYQVVQPYWVKEEPSKGAMRYYDLTCLGSSGVERRHGWFDPATRRIVQTG